MQYHTESQDPGERTKCSKQESPISKVGIDYLSGLFDGEGCVTISLNIAEHGRYQHTLNCLLCMTSRHPVDDFSDAFGGNVYGPIVRAGRQDQFNWEASPLVGGRALQELLPELRVKRRQAELALFFQANRARPVTHAELCWRDEIRIAGSVTHLLTLAT